jgi:dipeptidase D
MNRLSTLAVLLLLSGAAQAAEPSIKGPVKEPACVALDASLSEAAAVSFDKLSGPAGFERFRKAAASGNKALAGRLNALKPGKPVPAASVDLAACLLRRYVRARYGDAIIHDTQELIAFQTFAEDGKENWGKPEFNRQRDWLAAKAKALGLEFKDYDGRMGEITLAGPKPILAVLTHGDVQGVEGQHWSSPPFEARIVDGKIIGRGTEDDKGPIVTTLYSIVALRDAGWPLGSTLKLLIANGEESSWDEIPYYLARAPMPTRTLGIDANYPVTHAQKAYGLLTFRGEPAADAADLKSGQWRVVKMSGGSGRSIIPEGGEAVLEWVGDPGRKEEALAKVIFFARDWAEKNPPAKLTGEKI